MESPNANEKQTAEEIAAGWSFYAERTTEPVRHKTQRVRIVRGRVSRRDRGRVRGVEAAAAASWIFFRCPTLASTSLGTLP
jgi:hypothetical protein